MAVVLYHLVLSFWPFLAVPYAPSFASRNAALRAVALTPLSLACDGSFAVVTFFVLSGFVLTYAYYRAPRPATLTSAALRRYVRLTGPVFASVLLSYALLRLGAYRGREAAALIPLSGLEDSYGGQPLLFDLHRGAIPQGLLWSLLSEDGTRYNAVLWTIPFELFGSYLVFAFLALFADVRNRWLIYAALSVALLATHRTPMFDFVLGMGLCDAYVTVAPWRAGRPIDLRWGVWPVLGLAGCLACDRRLYLPGFSSLPGVEFHASIAAALLVAVPLVSGSLRRLADLHPFVWLGRVSFGLYLTHSLVIASVGARVYLALRRSTGWSHDGAALVASAVCLISSMGTAWAMYHLADRPSIAFGRWMARTVFHETTPSATPGGPDPAATPSDRP